MLSTEPGAGHKPEYGYSPHLTICDGPSRPFAKSLLDVLQRTRMYFTIIAGGCRIINSSPGQRSLNLWLGSGSNRMLSRIVGETIDVETAAAMPEWRRLMLIERI